MKNKSIYIILFLLILIVVLGIYFYSNEDRSFNYKELYLIQTSTIDLKNTVNKFQYYNEQGKIIKEETFKDKGDVSYHTIYGKYIYFYGPGGLYQTDSETYETKKLSNKDINIVHFFDDKMFYYENIGYKENGYESKICNNDKCIDLDFAVVDFAIDNEYYYVLGWESLHIYKNDEKIKEIDVSDLKIYQKILTIDHKYFLFTDEQIYEIKNEEVNNINDNELIKDINFAFYKKSSNERFIFDKVYSKIMVIKLDHDDLKKIKEYELQKSSWDSYSFPDQQPVTYFIDYDNSMLVIKTLDENISKVKLNLKKNESVFMVYKLK